MKKLLLLLFTVITFSCSQEEEKFKITSDAQLLNHSMAFRVLNIDQSQLDLQNIIKDDHLLIVSFKNSANRKVLNRLDDKGYIIMSALCEMESTIDPKDYGEAFKTGRFEGKFSILVSNGDYWGFDFKASKITNMFIGAGNGGVDVASIAGRTEACKGWTDKGGPLECAGMSIEAEGFISKALCYYEFIICFAAKVVDCYMQGCNMVLVTDKGTFILLDGEEIPTRPIANIQDPPIVNKPPRNFNIDPSIFN